MKSVSIQEFPEKTRQKLSSRGRFADKHATYVYGHLQFVLFYRLANDKEPMKRIQMRHKPPRVMSGLDAGKQRDLLMTLCISKKIIL